MAGNLYEGRAALPAKLKVDRSKVVQVGNRLMISRDMSSSMVAEAGNTLAISRDTRLSKVADVGNRQEISRDSRSPAVCGEAFK